MSTIALPPFVIGSTNWGGTMNSHFGDLATSINAAETNYLHLIGDSGRGTTNTTVRRFTSLGSSAGTSLVYTASAVNGDSVQIMTDGLYAFGYSFGQVSNTGREFGITRNSTQLTTIIESATFDITKVLAIACALGVSGVREGIGFCSWVGYLATGDVLRAQSTLGDRNGTNDRTQLRLSRLL